MRIGRSGRRDGLLEGCWTRPRAWTLDAVSHSDSLSGMCAEAEPGRSAMRVIAYEVVRCTRRVEEKGGRAVNEGFVTGSANESKRSLRLRNDNGEGDAETAS